MFVICSFWVSILLFQVLITQSKLSHDCLIKFFGREFSLVWLQELLSHRSVFIQNFTNKIILESFTLSKVWILGFYLRKYRLKTVARNLWKSESSSSVVQDWKSLEQLVRIKSIQVGFSWFLKQVFCLTIFSFGSILKSPNKMTLPYFCSTYLELC